MRPLVAEQIVSQLNHDVTPVVPRIGSVGASGDLAPLAHLALALIGEGEAWFGAQPHAGAEALRRAGLTPIALEAKEGLALINGTHVMAARGALALHDAQSLLRAGVVAAGLSSESTRTTDTYLDARVHALRTQDGQRRIAATLRRLLEGSEIIPSHKEGDPRVQDPYSFRCAPVVLGATLDLMEHVQAIIERELGAVTDNPLIFEEQDAGPSIVSAGNFHGMPLALHLDALAPALAHIAGLAERRIFYLLSASDIVAGLPPQLSVDPGVQSGMMIVQYSAAACCNELITLSTPSSVANIPTCAGMEDYNSFGPAAADRVERAVTLVRHVIAMELLCGAEALEHCRPLRTGRELEEAYALVRTVVERLTQDRPPAPDIAALETLIGSGAFDELGTIASGAE